MSEFEDLEKLIRLKRYEKPPEDYYEQFFREFQSRQRSEMLRQSAHGLFFERISAYLWGLGNRRWLYAGGAAYASVMIVFFLMPDSEKFASSDDGEPVILEMKVPAAGAKGREEGPEKSPAETSPVNENETSDDRQSQGGIREL